MKKLILLAILSMVAASCGVQRPLPPTIQSLNGNAAVQFGQQAEDGSYNYGVSAYTLYEVALGWDVTQTGAQGVKIIIASDYYCNTEVISRTLPTSCQTNASCVPLNYNGSFNQSLAHVFYGMDLSPLKRGTYYICIAAVMYDSTSAPSLPASLYLLADQYGTAY